MYQLALALLGLLYIHILFGICCNNINKNIKKIDFTSNTSMV